MIRVLLVDDQALVRSGFRVILDSQPDIEVVGEASDGTEAVEMAQALAPHVICMDVEMPTMNGIEASRLILASKPESPGAGNAPQSGHHEADRAEHGARPPAILVLTTFGHDQYLFDAIAAGVSGFLLKTSRAEQLIEAVRALAAGDALLGPDLTRAVMARAAATAGAAAMPDTAGEAQQSNRPNAQQQDQPDGQQTRQAGLQGEQGVLQAQARARAMDAAGLTERERDVLGLVAQGRSNGEIAAQLFLGEATVKTHVSNLLQKVGVRDRVQLVVWAHTITGG